MMTSTFHKLNLKDRALPPVTRFQRNKELHTERHHRHLVYCTYIHRSFLQETEVSTTTKLARRPFCSSKRIVVAYQALAPLTPSKISQDASHTSLEQRALFYCHVLEPCDHEKPIDPTIKNNKDDVPKSTGAYLTNWFMADGGQRFFWVPQSSTTHQS